MYTVYSLIDPRDNCTRYIGITDNVYQRMRAHTRDEGNTAKNAWLSELKKEQLLFIMHSIEKVNTFEQALAREEYWIHHYLGQGIPLLNIARTPEKSSKSHTLCNQIKLKEFFFHAYTGRTISTWEATDEEFNEFVKRHVDRKEYPACSWGTSVLRRQFIAHALNSGIDLEFCADIA
jgi:predicted GIY-YIG superfamily endonuclease